MARGIYIGKGNVCKKVSKIYIGHSEPYTQKTNLTITNSNISQYFTVTNGSYDFKGSGSTFTTTNAGLGGSTATTTLTAKIDTPISFTYSYSSEANYDKFTLIVNGTTVENGVSGATTTNTYSGTILTGQTISFQYKKDNSVDNNDDKCTFSNMTIQVSQQTYFRKVIAGYIGVGNKARPFFGGKGLVYYGQITAFGAQRIQYASTSIGNYALFGGGTADYDYDAIRSNIEVYDASLNKSYISLGTARYAIGAATAGNYAIFHGGALSSGTHSGYTDAYDNSLTRTFVTNSNNSYNYRDGATAGNWALFPGESAEAFSGTSLTKTSFSNITYNPNHYGATSLGDYALFAGGVNEGNTYSTMVTFYNASLTKSSSGNNGISNTKQNLGAGTINNKLAFFGGGYTSGRSSTVDVYNTSLTHLIADNLSVARDSIGVANIDNYILFAGGETNGNTQAVVDVYTASLTRSKTTDLSLHRGQCRGATVGNYAIIGGGWRHVGNSSEGTNRVDAYCIDTILT